MNPSFTSHRSQLPDSSSPQCTPGEVIPNSNTSSLAFASRPLRDVVPGAKRGDDGELVTLDDRSDGSSAGSRTFWERRLRKDVDPASRRLKGLQSEFEQMEVTLEVFARENERLKRKLLQFYAGSSTFGKMVRALASGSYALRLMFKLWHQMCNHEKHARSSSRELAAFRTERAKIQLATVLRMWGVQGRLLLVMAFSAWRLIFTLGFENRQQLAELMHHRQGREQVIQEYRNIEAELADERQRTKDLENSLDEANRANEAIKSEITRLNDRLFSHSEMMAENVRAKQALEDQVNRASKTLAYQQDTLEAEQRKAGRLSEQLEEKVVALEAAQHASNDKAEQNEQLRAELAAAAVTISQQAQAVDDKDEQLRRLAAQLSNADACISTLRDQADNYVVSHLHEPDRLSQVPPSVRVSPSRLTDKTDRHVTLEPRVDAPSPVRLSPPQLPHRSSPSNPILSGHTPPSHHPPFSPPLISHTSSSTVPQPTTTLSDPTVFAFSSLEVGATAMARVPPRPSHDSVVTTRSVSPIGRPGAHSPSSVTPHVPKFPVSRQFPVATTWAHSRPSSHGHHVDAAGRSITPLSVPPPHDGPTSPVPRSFAPSPPPATALPQQSSEHWRSPFTRHGMQRSASAKLFRYSASTSPVHHRVHKGEHQPFVCRKPPMAVEMGSTNGTTMAHASVGGATSTLRPSTASGPVTPMVPRLAPPMFAGPPGSAHVPMPILARKSLPSRHSMTSSMSAIVSVAVPAGTKEREHNHPQRA